MDYKRKGRKNYKMYYDLHGSFVEIMSKEVIDEEEYERRKDIAIADIVKEDKVKVNRKELKLQYNVTKLPEILNYPAVELARVLGIDARTITMWKRIPEKYPFIALD